MYILTKDGEKFRVYNSKTKSSALYDILPDITYNVLPDVTYISYDVFVKGYNVYSLELLSKVLFPSRPFSLNYLCVIYIHKALAQVKFTENKECDFVSEAIFRIWAPMYDKLKAHSQVPSFKFETNFAKCLQVKNCEFPVNSEFMREDHMKKYALYINSNSTFKTFKDVVGYLELNKISTYSIDEGSKFDFARLKQISKELNDRWVFDFIEYHESKSYTNVSKFFDESQELGETINFDYNIFSGLIGRCWTRNKNVQGLQKIYYKKGVYELDYKGQLLYIYMCLFTQHGSWMNKTENDDPYAYLWNCCSSKQYSDEGFSESGRRKKFKLMVNMMLNMASVENVAYKLGVSSESMSEFFNNIKSQLTLDSVIGDIMEGVSLNGYVKICNYTKRIIFNDDILKLRALKIKIEHLRRLHKIEGNKVEDFHESDRADVIDYRDLYISIRKTVLSSILFGVGSVCLKKAFIDVNKYGLGDSVLLLVHDSMIVSDNAEKIMNIMKESTVGVLNFESPCSMNII